MKKLLLVGLILIAAINAPAQQLCKGITLKGQQCHKLAVNGDYCRQHDTTVIRCKGITAKQQPCKKIPKKGELYCSLHLNQAK